MACLRFLHRIPLGLVGHNFIGFLHFEPLQNDRSSDRSHLRSFSISLRSWARPVVEVREVRKAPLLHTRCRCPSARAFRFCRALAASCSECRIRFCLNASS
jgi:hypothetical protein